MNVLLYGPEHCEFRLWRRSRASDDVTSDSRLAQLDKKSEGIKKSLNKQFFADFGLFSYKVLFSLISSNHFFKALGRIY